MKKKESTPEISLYDIVIQSAELPSQIANDSSWLSDKDVDFIPSQHTQAVVRVQGGRVVLVQFEF